MLIKEIHAKSIIVKSKLPDADYVVNPYVGCQFACLYCYASFMGRFVNEPLENWGNYLYVKANAVELFKKEYQRLKFIDNKPPRLMMSSVTDIYQGAEKQYKLAEGILSYCQEQQFSGLISILTKSPLVLRDIDIFKGLSNIEVGLTVTSTEDSISRFLEINAPSAKRRFETLTKLNEQGIKTYAFIGPLLPHFRYDHHALEDFIRALADTGVKSVYVEHINLKPYIVKRMNTQLADSSHEVQAIYQQAKFRPHQERLQAMILPLLDKYGLTIRLNEVISHST
jgi:DNA repair photolyase